MYSVFYSLLLCFYCYYSRAGAFSALTLLVGRQEGHPACKKTERWGAGVVICLERGADLHMAQRLPLPLTVSCFSKIQIGFTFLVPAHPGSTGQRAIKQVCVCVCVIHVQVLIFHCSLVIVHTHFSCAFCNKWNECCLQTSEDVSQFNVLSMLYQIAHRSDYRPPTPGCHCEQYQTQRHFCLL